MVANWAHNPEVVGSSPTPASSVYATTLYIKFGKNNLSKWASY